MKYYGTFSANGGSTYSGTAVEFTNKKVANATIRNIAIGNTLAGNGCYWRVTDEDGKIVFSGGYYPGIGIRYGVNDYKSIY